MKAGKELISVIMPVYGVEKYVGAAIQSVLDQTHRDFELIVVNDASPDGSGDVIRTFRDPRIRAIHLDRNGGVAAARNRAIAEARGRFLALMDSDDVMTRGRLEKQLAFMQRHPRIALGGGWCRTLGPDATSRPVVTKSLIDPRAVNASLVFGNVFCTSTIMMRRDAVPDGGFRQRYAEDYDFLVRVAEKYRLAIANEVFVNYRIRPDSAMHTYALERKKNDVWLSQLPLFEALGITPSPQEREIHLFSRINAGNVDCEQLAAIYQWYGKLVAANRQARIYPDLDFRMAASYMWFEQLFRATGCGIEALRMFLTRSLSFTHPQPLLIRAKFIAKAAIGKKFVRARSIPAGLGG